MRTSIVIIGDVNLDIVTHVGNLDLSDKKKLDHVPAKIEAKAGGTGFMLALAARRLKYGSIKLVCKFGSDPIKTNQPDIIAKLILQELKVANVKSVFTLDTTIKTGIVTIMYFKNNERVMVANAGANKTFTKNDINTDYINSIMNSNILMVSGYALLSPNRSKAVIQLMRLAKKHKKIVVLDLVPHELYKTIKREVFDTATENCNVLVSNIHTIKHFINLDDNESKIEEIVHQIANLLLKKHQLVILRPDIHTQYVFIKNRLSEKSSTNYSKLSIEDRRGFSEFLTLKIIQKYYPILISNVI